MSDPRLQQEIMEYFGMKFTQQQLDSMNEFVADLINQEFAMLETINIFHPHFSGSDEQDAFSNHQHNLVRLNQIQDLIRMQKPQPA